MNYQFTIPVYNSLISPSLPSQLIDLGEPAYSQGSQPGCPAQETACGRVGCGWRGRCVGGLRLPECECEPGWVGPECTTPTIPAYLGAKSYVKIALSFSPPSGSVSVQVRVRTRGAPNGLLLRLSIHQEPNAFTVQVSSN